MELSLLILSAIVVVGAVLYLHHRWQNRRHPADDDVSGETPAVPAAPAASEEKPAGEECCGLHEVCERGDSLLAAASTKVEYFDDEELDRFRGRAATDYTPSEVEEWRDVLLTLRPEEIAAWGRSVQLRGLELPPDVRDELLLLASEARERHSQSKS